MTSPAATRQPSGLQGAPLPTLQLRQGEDRRVRGGHAWVFSNEVDTAVSPLSGFEPGSIVELRAAAHSKRDAFLGLAYINPHALICARVLTRDPDERIDSAWMVSRLRRALRLRESCYARPYYRMVFGESDGLPGLILDRYGDVLVGQIATLGMEQMRAMVEAALDEVVQPRVLVWKNEGSARELEQLPREVIAARGTAPQRLELIENGLEFEAPFADGQKTGWFFDQAENRALLQRLLTGGSRAAPRTLDVCSYAGGWAVSMLKAGATEATCVDSSQAALDAAQRNAQRNGFTLGVDRGDAFDVLARYAAEGRTFDVIVLDPPAFIKRRKDHPQGEAAYRRLNAAALRLLTPDGLLVSCSCSYHLDSLEMQNMLQSAARQAHRDLQIIAVGGQGPDHPVHPAIRESRYLKAFFCRVI